VETDAQSGARFTVNVSQILQLCLSAPFDRASSLRCWLHRAVRISTLVDLFLASAFDTPSDADPAVPGADLNFRAAHAGRKALITSVEMPKMSR
jgi:hypothetical protein